MQVFRCIVLAAAIAGLLVGLIVTLAQQVGTAPLILQGEVYERTAEADIHHHAGSAEHDHGQAAWEPADGLERTVYSAAANVLTAIGFALLLCGLYALRGHAVTWRAGLLWGLGGFAVFVVAPSFGLPPKLPGMPTAELEARQLWWIATAAATALALGLLVYRRASWAVIVALVLLAAPHLIGAPQPGDTDTDVPPALAREFIMAAMLTSLLFWTLLGSLTAVVYRRLST